MAESGDARPPDEGRTEQVDRLVAGLDRLRPEIGALAEELIRLLRGDAQSLDDARQREPD